MSEKFQVQKEHPAHLDRFTGLQDPIHGADTHPEFFIHARIFTALDGAQVCPASSGLAAAH
jgi:hypothetical protein